MLLSSYLCQLIYILSFKFWGEYFFFFFLTKMNAFYSARMISTEKSECDIYYVILNFLKLLSTLIRIRNVS